MTLATKNGSLIVKDGSLAEDCGCCQECVDISFAVSGLAGRGCGGGGVQHGLRTIEIPQRFELPCKVYISGVVDDDLSIDGSVVQGGQYVNSFFSACNPAHAVCYSFLATNRTFTVAAIDNYGGNTSYTLKICFGTLGAEGACCEGTTCSVKPQCQCQGTGKVFKGVGTTCSPNPCKACLDCGGTGAPTTFTASVSNAAFTGASVNFDPACRNDSGVIAWLNSISLPLSFSGMMPDPDGRAGYFGDAATSGPFGTVYVRISVRIPCGSGAVDGDVYFCPVGTECMVSRSTYFATTQTAAGVCGNQGISLSASFIQQPSTANVQSQEPLAGALRSCRAGASGLWQRFFTATVTVSPNPLP